ncbi:MAG: acetyl-CoA carboxylase biotin carboxyl carrier protein [Verrucomicrobia bacterium]|nr:acetyl-CoA carboxylase biotin carboxyl carrier protein [Verrucomicrobiota bacterium]
MDMKSIKELMATMEKSGLKRVRIKEEKGFEIELEREAEHPVHPQPIPRPEPVHYHHPHPHPHHRPPGEEEKKVEKKEGTYITSPMVGTFYSAASPDDQPFVKVGDKVEEETVVCIIEAMKVMNEVKAGKKGKIAEVLVSNSDPVEFGTNLFRIV